MIRNRTSRGQGAQGRDGLLTQNLRALRACEARIRDLQARRDAPDRDSLRGRDACLRAAVDTALRQTRICVTEGDFQRADPASLAGLVNSFSKRRLYPVTLAVDTIVDCIGQEVSWRATEGSLARWAPVHLTLVANGLSKSQGPGARMALTHLAQTLLSLRRLAPDTGWTGQRMAMMCNALSKGEGADIQQALTHLAQALLEHRPLGPEDGWTAHHLAMMANGLTKGEGAAVQDALAHLAKALPDLAQLTTESGWNAQHLAMMASGLAKSTGEAVNLALIRLAQVVRARPLSLTQGWGPQDLAMITNGLSKAEGADIQEALTHLAQEIPRRHPGREQGWTPRHLAMVASGLSKGKGAAVHKALTQLARAVPGACDLTPESGWTAPALAMMASGLGKGEGACVQAALARLARGFLMRRPLTAALGWNARNLAMMANALTRSEEADKLPVLTHLAQGLLRVPQLTPEAGWSARSLAMMTHALARGEGPDVRAALERLAEAVPDERRLTAAEGWTAQPFAMMAHGLGKGTGPCGRQALERLARALPAAGDLTQASGWIAQSLAMVANGLAKGEGACIKAALARCAGALPAAAELGLASGWSAQTLAMMANGLGKAEGPEVQNALCRLAQAVMSCDLTAGQGQSGAPLALLMTGLVKIRDAAARQAVLAHLAEAACHLPLMLEHCCTCQDLSMMMDATGPTLAGHALFEKITSAAVQRAQQEPELLCSLLDSLSRCALSALHLQAARRLLDALMNRDPRPRSGHERHEMLWRISLFHYASQQDRPADPALTAFFAQAGRHCLSWPLAGGDNTSDTACDDYWHGCWACDYWQPSPPGARPAVTRPAAVCSAVPYWQSRVFERFRDEMPGHDLCQEVRINHFPVDILIDERLCVEVDGPDHFFEVPVDRPVDRPGEPRAVFVQQRRTKDLFIDHMLRRYGYRVVRIADAEDPASLDKLVGQVRSALDAPAAEHPEPRDARERAASPDQCV